MNDDSVPSLPHQNIQFGCFDDSQIDTAAGALRSWHILNIPSMSVVVLSGDVG